MSIVPLEVSLAVLFGAIAIDIIFGEPRKYVHPTTVVRKVGQFFDPYFRIFNNKRVSGLLYVFFAGFVFSLPLFVILIGISEVTLIYVIVAIILLKASFSITAIGQEISPVVKALEEGRIDEARTFASRVVRRDTTGLDSSRISSAIVETISVTLLDEVVAPFFYFSVFGIVGAFLSRVVNIIDTLVGQKNKRNYEFGKWPAIVHTVFNYVPAKIAALFVMLGSELMNYRVSSVPFSAARAPADSTNNGWVMGAMASSLNLRLEKVGYYILNENGFEPTVGDIKRALNTYYMSVYIFLILFVIPVMLVISLILMPYL